MALFTWDLLQDILTHTRDVTELVQHINDPHRGHRCAFQRRDQDSSQSIAQSYAIAMLQRTDNEFPIIASFGFALDLRHYHTRDCHGTLSSVYRTVHRV
jgi:hypothetical protein